MRPQHEQEDRVWQRVVQRYWGSRMSDLEDKNLKTGKRGDWEIRKIRDRGKDLVGWMVVEDWIFIKDFKVSFLNILFIFFKIYDCFDNFSNKIICSISTLLIMLSECQPNFLSVFVWILSGNAQKIRQRRWLIC